MEESFNELMLRIKSEYYADNARMNEAFERLRNQNSNRDENITKHSAMDNRSQSVHVARKVYMAKR